MKKIKNRWKIGILTSLVALTTISLPLALVSCSSNAKTKQITVKESTPIVNHVSEVKTSVSDVIKLVSQFYNSSLEEKQNLLYNTNLILSDLQLNQFNAEVTISNTNSLTNLEFQIKLLFTNQNRFSNSISQAISQYQINYVTYTPTTLTFKIPKNNVNSSQVTFSNTQINHFFNTINSIRTEKEYNKLLSNHENQFYLTALDLTNQEATISFSKPVSDKNLKYHEVNIVIQLKQGLTFNTLNLNQLFLTLSAPYFKPNYKFSNYVDPQSNEMNELSLSKIFTLYPF